jgi:hypothetical protein
MRIKALCEKGPTISRPEKLALIISRRLSAGFIINHPAPLSLARLISLLFCDLNIGLSVMVGEEKRDSKIKTVR